MGSATRHVVIILISARFTSDLHHIVYAVGRGEDMPGGQEAAPADGVTVCVMLQPHVPRPGVRGADLAPEDVI